MSDELQLQFDVHDRPAAVMEQWRREPPKALEDGQYELTDESFNSLTWEARYMDWPQKITVVASLGVALLFKGFMESRFKLVVRFDDGGDGVHTRISITGRAHPRTREALGQMAALNGGTVGLAVGV